MELIWITAAKVLEGHKLHLAFNNGTCKVFESPPLPQPAEAVGMILFLSFVSGLSINAHPLIY